jgi:hypothetical protein
MIERHFSQPGEDTLRHAPPLHRQETVIWPKTVKTVENGGALGCVDRIQGRAHACLKQEETWRASIA